MDSQHRHELGENALAGWLADKIEAVKPHIPMIAIGFAAAAVGSYLWSSWSTSADQADSAGWQAYSLAVNAGQTESAVEALALVGTEHQGSGAAPWASITAADAKLMMAARSYLSQRAASDDLRDEAKSIYEALLADRTAPEAIRDRAQFGLARAKELEGDLEAAREAYGKVAGAFKSLAEKRAEQLAEQKAQDDYAWLATAQSSPMGGFAPGAGGFGARPSGLPANLPLPEDDGGTNSGDAFQDLLNSIKQPADDAAGAEESSETDAGDDAEESGESAETEEPMSGEAETAEAETGEAETGEAETGEAETGEEATESAASE